LPECLTADHQVVSSAFLANTSRTSRYIHEEIFVIISVCLAGVKAGCVHSAGNVVSFRTANDAPYIEIHTFNT